MKLERWGQRVANWKRTRSHNESLDFHLNRLHEEVSECFKALREGHKVNEIYYNGLKPEGFPIELAQVVEQALWIAEVTGINLENAMECDMDYKEGRRVKEATTWA